MNKSHQERIVSRSDLPPGYSIEQTDGLAVRTYVNKAEQYIVTKHTGTRKHFRGNGKAEWQKAARWLWRFHDGLEDKYEAR